MLLSNHNLVIIQDPSRTNRNSEACDQNKMSYM
uniref:Uncharacterized protein n=1 Tax=Arundo donax TaxID=35708 RepID=A0A0A9AR12_ARUDO